MGKKKHPETDKEKELLEKRLLKMQIAATITEIIVGAITGISALLKRIPLLHPTGMLFRLEFMKSVVCLVHIA